MMAPKLVHDIKEADSFLPKITCFSSLKAVYHIIRKLTEKQRKMFENTCFGHFLGMHKLQFSIPIVHCLLLRVVESPNTDEMWFKVGDTTIRFSAQEFRIVTGLNCSPYPKVNVHNKKIEGIGLMEDLLNRDMSLYNDNLESIFMEASSDNDLFMVKLALLYFLETFLLGREKKSPIDKEHILLVDDIEEFNKYPWGRDCFERTMKSLQEAVRVQKNRNYKAYDLKGFAYAFQVWAYEVIPTLGHRCAGRIGLGLACIVNWSSVGSPSYKKVQGIFEEKNIEVRTVLQAVTEEQQDSCQNFITPGSDEVPQKSMDEDAHQGDPADSAEEYNSATAAAFPFPLAEAPKDELSTPAHCCEVEGQTEEFPPAAIAESLREEAVMSSVAITVTEKRKSPDEAALVEEPGLGQKDRCHQRESPMSPSSLDQGRSLHDHIPSSSSAKLEVCTVLQVVTEEQQDSCHNFIATPESDDEVPPTSIQENEMFEATSPSMDGDAHQGDPADTAEDYYSAIAAAFPFPLSVPSKEEWSTPAHCCEVEGQIEESPTAMAESCREVAVTSTVAVEVKTKKKSPDEAALVEEPGLYQKDRCHGREAPMSLSSLNQGRSLHEHISSSSSAKTHTLGQQDSNQSSPIGTPTGNICPHPSFSVASWSSSHLSGDNSSFHTDQQTEVAPPTFIEQHASSSAPDKVKYETFPVQGIGRSQISSSLLAEEAFFMELDSILDKSPKDLLDFSSCTILTTSQEINQAKSLLQQCLSTNFESLIHSFQRDQVNSSLEKLSKVGHFPSSMINTVRTFRVNFLVNTDVYLKCKENVKRADKSKKEGMVLREELANNRSRFNKLVGDIWIVADEIEELKKKLAEKEKYIFDLKVRANDLVEMTQTSKNVFDRLHVKFKNLGKEKQNAEELMADIESQWDELKREIAEFL